MAKKKKSGPASLGSVSDINDFSSELIAEINRGRGGDRVAFNLAVDEAPTNIRRWISTGSEMLDIICANRPEGGIPEGRIIEIFGAPSIGKSHIALQIARQTQMLGGMVVYIDTENATSVDNLRLLGVNMRERFVFIQATCIEDIFEHIEQTIERSRSVNADIPIVVIWDSIAGAAPRAELDGTYDDHNVGTRARALSRGFRKITDCVGANRITLVCLNQLRTKIGVMYGDPDVAPGGKALPFHSSIRIKLIGGTQVKDADGEVVGINVKAKTIKNKVAPPFRSVDFVIMFGRGVFEHERMFELLMQNCKKKGQKIEIPDGKKTKKVDAVMVTLEGSDYFVSVRGSGGWKEFDVWDSDFNPIVETIKYHKPKFKQKVLDDPTAGMWCRLALQKVLIREIDFDENSYEEAKSLVDSFEMPDEI